MRSFQTTVWATIRAAGAGREGAVGELVGRYRPAVVRFARCRGVDEGEAEDVAQEVFTRLFADRVLERADARRGRFRNLLLAVTRNVLGHHFERRAALRRGGGRPVVSLDRGEGEDPIDPAAPEAPDPDFDREWLAAMLSSALRRLERENPDYAACLNALLVEGRSYAQIAAALGRTETSVRNALSRGRAKLARLLRDEVASYASSREEYQAELELLSGLLGGQRR